MKFYQETTDGAGGTIEGKQWRNQHGRGDGLTEGSWMTPYCGQIETHTDPSRS